MSVAATPLLLGSTTYLGTARTNILERIAVLTATKGLSGGDHGASVNARGPKMTSGCPSPLGKDIIPAKLRWLVMQPAATGAQCAIRATEVSRSTSAHAS